MRERIDELPVFDDEDRATFLIEDPRERADALKQRLVPKLRVLYSFAAERLEKVYGADALEGTKRSVSPDHRKFAEKTKSFSAAYAGLVGAQVEGKYISPKLISLLTDEGLRTVLWINKSREAEVYVDLLESYPEQIRTLLDSMDRATRWAPEGTPSMTRPSLALTLRPARIRALENLWHDGLAGGLRAYPVDSRQIADRVAADFVALFPIYRTVVDLLRGMPDRFREHYESFRATRLSLAREVEQEDGGRDVPLAVSRPSAESTHATYLLTWNPRNWAWDDLEEVVRRTAEGEAVADRWSCGNTKRIRPGDRLFLLKQGVEPRGIVAAGWATSESYEGPHWDAERRGQGETALLVDARFDRVLDAEVDGPLPLSQLESGPLASMNWNTPASGIEIREGVAQLERLWREHIGLFAIDGDGAAEVAALEGEVRMGLRRHRARERWKREEKIAAYKRNNAGRLPCEVCGFDFFVVYGEIGLDYAQVHHRKPLGDRTRATETTLDDLAVLCANCHVMVHRGGLTRSIEALFASKDLH